jgi:hypothetical protein
MVTKNPSLNPSASEFVPSQSGSPDFTQNNITRDHLLDVRGPDDAFDIDNSFQSEFETRCADSSIEVSQSEDGSLVTIKITLSSSDVEPLSDILSPLSS